MLIDILPQPEIIAALLASKKSPKTFLSIIPPKNPPKKSDRNSEKNSPKKYKKFPLLT